MQIINHDSVVAWAIVFFSWVHTIAHLNNVAQLSAKNNQGFKGFLRAGFLTGPTWTGWIMLIALMLMVSTSVEKPRRANFERFWYTHHLFVVFFIFWSMHGIWCMIPADFEPFCAGEGVFYEYFIYGGVIYLAERVMREIRGRHATVVSKVIQHPSNVVEIQIKKEKTVTKAGQVSDLVSKKVSCTDMINIVHLPLLPRSISLAIPPIHSHQCPGGRLHLRPRPLRRRFHQSSRQNFGLRLRVWQKQRQRR